MPPRARRARLRIVASLAVCAAAVPACTPPVDVATAGITAASVGATVFSDGAHQSAQIVTLDEAFHASLTVMEELQFRRLRTTATDLNATVTAIDDNGRKIKITLERRSPFVTKIRIRVGILGDPALSKLLLTAIHARLPAQPTAEPEAQ